MRHVLGDLRIPRRILAAALFTGVAACAAAATGGSGSHRWTDSRDGDSYVLSLGHDSISTNLSLDEYERLREKRSGDFLWFRRDGKTFLIEDAETLKRARALFAPLRALDPEREELNRRQETLSDSEQELDREQGEIDRQIDRLTDGDDGGETEGDGDEEFMVSEETASPTDEERAEIDRQLDELRSQQDALRPREREIQAKDRELDAVERSLDAREEKLEKEAEGSLWQLIDTAIKSGAAKPF